MIRELLLRHGSTVWPVLFLLGSMAVYLTVMFLAWLRPGSREDLDHLASLPLAPDTGCADDREGEVPR